METTVICPQANEVFDNTDTKWQNSEKYKPKQPPHRNVRAFPQYALKEAKSYFTKNTKKKWRPIMRADIFTENTQKWQKVCPTLNTLTIRFNLDLPSMSQRPRVSFMQSQLVKSFLKKKKSVACMHSQYLIPLTYVDLVHFSSKKNPNSTFMPFN